MFTCNGLRKLSLLEYLQEYEIEEVNTCGIATDYCVRATNLDSVKEGFKTRCFLDLCAGGSP